MKYSGIAKDQLSNITILQFLISFYYYSGISCISDITIP